MIWQEKQCIWKLCQVFQRLSQKCISDSLLTCRRCEENSPLLFSDFPHKGAWNTWRLQGFGSWQTFTNSTCARPHSVYSIIPHRKILIITMFQITVFTNGLIAVDVCISTGTSCFKKTLHFFRQLHIVNENLNIQEHLLSESVQNFCDSNVLYAESC